MKKRFIILIIVLFSTFSFSQEEKRLGVRIGYSMQHPDEYFINVKDINTGFLGFGAGIKANNHIFGSGYFAPELSFLYRQLMTSKDIAYDENYNKVKVDTDITEFAISIVPLMFQFKIADIFYISPGLKFDIPFETKYNIKGKGINISMDLKDLRAYFDFGLILEFSWFINKNTALDIRASGAAGALRDGALPGQGLIQCGLGITYFFM